MTLTGVRQASRSSAPHPPLGTAGEPGRSAPPGLIREARCCKGGRGRPGPCWACFSILPMGQFSVTSWGSDPHGHSHAYVNNLWDAKGPRACAYFTESASQAQAWETAPPHPYPGAPALSDVTGSGHPSFLWSNSRNLTPAMLICPRQALREDVCCHIPEPSAPAETCGSLGGSSPQNILFQKSCRWDPPAQWGRAFIAMRVSPIKSSLWVWPQTRICGS